MDVVKQQLLLEYLLSSPDTYALCSSITAPEYFDPYLRNSVSFLNKYYNDYSKIPALEQMEAETGVKFAERIVTPDKIEYCSNEIEAFCKQRALERAVLAASKAVQEGDGGSIEQIVKDALMVSLQRNLGLNYFEDPYARLMRLKNANLMQSTGWTDLDNVLGGGISRGEMLLWSANSGGGKSLTMGNLCLNFMERGMNALYISLELSEDLIAKRFDSMMTGITQPEILHRIDEVAALITSKREGMGNLYVKQMPAGTTPQEIRAYIQEFIMKEGFVPDIIAADYLDLMNPNEKVSADNVFEKDKRVAEQFRNILVDFNMFGTSASQQNRSAVGAADLNHSHIAGGISKVNTTDNYISIIMTDQMRASGEMIFQMLKTRSSDGVGKQVPMKWIGASMRIVDVERSAASLTFNKAPGSIKDESQLKEKAGGDTMMQMFDL